jgi:hypothetical protein
MLMAKAYVPRAARSRSHIVWGYRAVVVDRVVVVVVEQDEVVEVGQAPGFPVDDGVALAPTGGSAQPGEMRLPPPTVSDAREGRYFPFR